MWFSTPEWSKCLNVIIKCRVKGGMGAALLKNPETALDILKTLRRNINCPVTCKIRLLDTVEDVSDMFWAFLETSRLHHRAKIGVLFM